jgi:hypothetical protein
MIRLEALTTFLWEWMSWKLPSSIASSAISAGAPICNFICDSLQAQLKKQSRAACFNAEAQKTQNKCGEFGFAPRSPPSGDIP